MAHKIIREGVCIAVQRPLAGFDVPVLVTLPKRAKKPANQSYNAEIGTSSKENSGRKPFLPQSKI